jgi:hypothetical protein
LTQLRKNRHFTRPIRFLRHLRHSYSVRHQLRARMHNLSKCRLMRGFVQDELEQISASFPKTFAESAS